MHAFKCCILDQHTRTKYWKDKYSYQITLEGYLLCDCDHNIYNYKIYAGYLHIYTLNT